MGADASIYNMIRPPERLQGPLDQYGSLLQLRNMADTGELNALHRQKLAGDMAEEEAFKSKIADWVKSGQQGTLPADAYAASPARAQAFDKSRTDAQKSEADLRKTKIETLQKQAQATRDIIARVQSDAEMPWAAEQVLKLHGPDVVQKDPFFQGPFTPEKKAAALATGDKMLEQLTPKMEKIDDGKTIRMVDINPITNPAVKGMNFAKQLTPGEVQQGNQPVWDEARGVFVMKPGAPAAAPSAQSAAAPAAAPGAGQGVVKPAGLPPKPTDVHNLRNEFNALPEVKQFKDTLPIVEAARAAPDTRAGDIQLAYAVGKILDPNSVVREGELKMSADAQTMLAKYYGEVQSAVTGNGRLSPATRGELVKMLDSAVTQRETAYKQAETTYKGIADKNGIPVDQVIITPMKRTGQPGQPGQDTGAPKLFDKMPEASQYAGRRVQADDGTVYQSDGKRWVRQGAQARAKPSTEVPL